MRTYNTGTHKHKLNETITETSNVCTRTTLARINTNLMKLLQKHQMCAHLQPGTYTHKLNETITESSNVCARTTRACINTNLMKLLQNHQMCAHVQHWHA